MVPFPNKHIRRRIWRKYIKKDPICEEESEDQIAMINDEYWSPAGITEFAERVHLLASVLKRLPNLQEVTIGIDEVGLVRDWSRERNGQQEIVMRPQDIGFQLNLIILPAVHELRQLRIPKVVFSDTHEHIVWKYKDSWPDKYKVPRGPIPGGVLETLIAPEMMQSRKPSRKRKREEKTPPNPKKYLKILDFPPELRNRVYEQLLVQKGAVNPSLRIPSSHRYYRHKRLHVPPPIPSVLAFLRFNKQIYAEASKIYYSHNDFIFYAPTQFLAFYAAIGHVQRSSLESIGIWCYQYSDAPIPATTVIGLVMQQLQTLPHLKKLKLFLPLNEDSLTLKDPTYLDWEHLDDLRALRRRGVKIEVSCPRADRILWVKQNQYWVGKGLVRPSTTNTLTRAQRAQRVVDHCDEIADRIDREHGDTPPATPTSSIERSESSSSSSDSDFL
ncbi:uncharacterized protein N0V89_000159 [Didymosphaeria variabile]|uniref:Uncharacterized protein n=1 Tax=Didymosphaeria variabile TaxID=1932322 RepID=A0A9W8XTQ8_9PLEO|nr:uncharacterized protein N0V89_000159 [Didymosphaeria variabile]KAJ4359604.1 hypothetical protein N0V89_000159 [Didymosphaeria variabile]